MSLLPPIWCDTLSPVPEVDVVVFLGSRWSVLAHQATRWGEVIRRWRSDPAVASISVVDWPRWSPRPFAAGRLVQVREQESWAPDVRVLDVTIGGRARPTPIDGMVWRAVGRALEQEVPSQAVAVATVPFWNELLAVLRARRTAFDAVDDWRAHPVADQLGARIRRGYRRSRDLDTHTANSVQLASRLEEEFGFRPIVVPNGVDAARFAGSGAPAPEDLPEGPFAVYVGVVQQRVDLTLIEATAAAGHAVVVAGPADADVKERLESVGVRMLGRVEHDLVPGLLQRAAVGLLPHLRNDLTTSMDPMKLLEYLAAGLPVVSTRLPGVEELSQRILVADEPARFSSAVGTALGCGRTDSPDPAVAGRSWELTASELRDVHLGGTG